MMEIFSSLVAIGILIAVASLPVSGQDRAPARPIVFTTPASNVRITHPGSKGSGSVVATGTASLTLVEAHADDTLSGLLILTLNDEELGRTEMKQGKKGPPPIARDQLPAKTIRRELRLHWQRGTACPELELPITPFKFTLGETEFETLPFRLRIQESQERLTQLLCSWSRQINAGRPRQGIIMAINRLLVGEE